LVVILVVFLVLGIGCIAPPTAIDVEPFIKDYPNERLSGIRRLSFRTFTVTTTCTNFFDDGHRLEIVPDGDSWKVKKLTRWRR
jgi:hypothetical protein